MSFRQRNLWHYGVKCLKYLKQEYRHKLVKHLPFGQETYGIMAWNVKST